MWLYFRPFVAMMRNMNKAKASILVLSLGLLICDVGFASPDRYARKIDEFYGTDWEAAMARLDNFDIVLKNEPSSIGVFIVYGGQRRRRGEARAWGKCLKDYMVNRRGINADSIVVLDGGYRDSLTVELWQSVSKEYIPTPAPTVDQKDVKFRRGKTKNWRGLCNI